MRCEAENPFRRWLCSSFCPNARKSIRPARLVRAYDGLMRRVLSKGQTAKAMEVEAALARAPRTVTAASEPEPIATLIRRGLRPTHSKPDLPFPRDWSTVAAEQLATRLGHYAFRLFLRGAILHPGAFRPAEGTQYVTPAMATRFAGFLEELGLARESEPGIYCLVHPAKSFGGVLEWYVAHELHRRLGFLVPSRL